MRLGPILAACALAALTTACNKSEPAPAAPAAGETAGPAPVPAAAAGPSAEEKKALLASLPAPYNTADLDNGEAKFALCQSCHTITPDGANMTGPNLHGIFGRKSAANAEFKYSDALKAANWTWDADHLNQWLEKPQTFLPGTKMAFAGLKKPEDVANVIAYLTAHP